MAHGYAIMEGDVVDLKTVSESPRAAKVNWLYARAGVVPTRDWTDQRIADTFQVYADRGVVRCVPVEITPI